MVCCIFTNYVTTAIVWEGIWFSLWSSQITVFLFGAVQIAIYSTAIKSILCHEKTQDILFLERSQGAREIKFREFSSDIKGFLAVEYIVLFYEARVK